MRPINTKGLNQVSANVTPWIIVSSVTAIASEGAGAVLRQPFNEARDVLA